MKPLVINKDSTLYKSLRAALFVSISAILASLLNFVKADPAAFGSATVVINALLVILVDLIKPYLLQDKIPSV